MDKWKGVINANEVAQLYEEKLNNWLLLEVIQMGSNGRAKEFRLIAFNQNKEALHKMMDSDEWDWDKKYIFVFADPESLCDL